MGSGFSEIKGRELFFALSFLLAIIFCSDLFFQSPGICSVGLLPERQSLTLKLVDNNRALVTETRYLELKKGINEIYLNYPGVKIIPNSIQIQFMQSPQDINLLKSSTFLKIPSSLTWHIYSKKEGVELVRISYLVEGLISFASYTAQVGSEQDLLLLEGWLTLQNQTGEEFKGANLLGKTGEKWKVDLKGDEIKKLLLFGDVSLPLQKIYLLDREKYGEKVFLEYHFFNETGKLLFPGKIRVYQRKEETLTFLGEDNIETVNRGEKIKITIGSVQDIKAERKLIEFSRINLRRDNLGNIEVYDTREEYEINLKNQKKEEVRIILKEYIPYSWEMITSEPTDYVKEDAHHIIFEINLAPQEEKKIHYQIQRKNLLPQDSVRPLI